MGKEHDAITERDAEKRAAFIEEVKSDINGEDDWFIRNQANARIKALEEDGELFGLVPHEQRELEQLRTLVQS